MGEQSRYEQRGVSSSKPDVHAATANLDKGLFPGGFCKLLPDFDDLEMCILQHADGAGTKAALAYLVWKHTGNLEVWKGIARDSLFMNLDDAQCVGVVDKFNVSLTINRNKTLIAGEVIKTLIDECQSVCEMLTERGIRCQFTGGETADVGDLVRTITVDNTITARIRRDQVIDASRINTPAVIVGFSSTGRANWEIAENSGIGSNGLTNARHDVLSKDYRAETETYAPQTDPDLVYCGDFRLEDRLPDDQRFTMATALLSPTRTYLPLVKMLLEQIGRENILGLIHCSGGGQTKIGKFGATGITYVKNNLLPMPPLFRFLEYARGLPWRQMYESYNMGHRLEGAFRNRDIADECIEISRSLGIEAQIIGEVISGKRSTSPNRTLVIATPGGDEVYDF